MEHSLDALIHLTRGRRVAVLTGAGVSVDSGIPDYRGPTTRHLVRNPVKHDEFVRSAAARRRYWSRASRGYAAVGEAQPNAAHTALAALEAAGHLTGLITQNVDGLHQAAGSERVVELHGKLREVVCLACAKTYRRDAVQAQIARENPAWLRTLAPVAPGQLAPDGDAELAPETQARFRAPQCPACGGDLMPDVVFFGGSVPKPRVAEAFALVESADALLVAGSSLTVFSGYRFVRFAARRAMPIAIVSLGPTRGDAHAHVKVDGPVGEVLPGLLAGLKSGGVAG